MSNSEYSPEQIEVLKGLEPLRKRDEKSYTSDPEGGINCLHCGEPHSTFQCWISKK
jgi:DNA gyrase/topoisomerase IV subunit B